MIKELLEKIKINESNNYLKQKIFKLSKIIDLLQENNNDKNSNIEYDILAKEILVIANIIHIEGTNFMNKISFFSEIFQNIDLTESVLATDYSFNIALEKLIIIYS